MLGEAFLNQEKTMKTIRSICTPILMQSASLSLLLLAVSASAQRQQAWLETAIEQTDAPAMGLVLFNREGIDALAVAGKRAKGSDVGVEADDPWHLGSNTKAMTALLTAILAEDGALDFDDRITDVLGDLIDDIDPGWQAVDYRKLLSHCSGLPANAGRWTSLQLMGDESRDDRADRLSYAGGLLKKSPAKTPGESFEYSNAGYVVAGAMLEAQTGKNWKALMQERIFAPLGLASAGFGPPGEKGEMDAPRGHSPGLAGGLNAAEPGATADNPPALNPAGRVHMSLRDYATFLIEFLRGLNGEGRLLDQAGYRQLIEPGCNENYAFGWGVTDDGSLQHSGSNTMWFAQARLWPKTGRGMVVVSNDGRLERQREAFDELFQQGRRWLDSPDKSPQKTN